jgi:hypothetical protein
MAIRTIAAPRATSIDRRRREICMAEMIAPHGPCGNRNAVNGERYRRAVSRRHRLSTPWRHDRVSLPDVTHRRAPRERHRQFELGQQIGEHLAHTGLAGERQAVSTGTVGRCPRTPAR